MNVYRDSWDMLFVAETRCVDKGLPNIFAIQPQLSRNLPFEVMMLQSNSRTSERNRSMVTPKQ
jgi:hypothetical protein